MINITGIEPRSLNIASSPLLYLPVPTILRNCTLSSRIPISAIVNHFNPTQFQIPIMLCELCWYMLRGQERMQWKGSFDLNFKHHETVGSLRTSAKTGCRICRTLRDQFPHSLEERWYNNPKQSVSIIAQLSQEDVWRPNRTSKLENPIYRLDFTTRCGAFNGRRTFVLKDTSQLSPTYMVLHPANRRDIR